MTIGLYSKKCGMTRVFTEDGTNIPVTVLEVMPNRVVQIKTLEQDGYKALQVTFGIKTVNKINKALRGHYAKAKVEPGCQLVEIKLGNQEECPYTVGAELKADIFKEGAEVDVSGFSKGKGFQGTIKRHNFSTQDATHGNSLSHRAPGSIGQRQTPGRVFKNKKMAGHMGDDRCTVQNQEIVKIDKERNLLFIKGAIPGAIGNMVMVKPAVKVKKKGE